MSGRRGHRHAFTLVEVIASLFITAMLAFACIALISNRDNGMDATAALEQSPAAIDTLQAALNAEGLDDLNAALAGGGATRLICRDAADVSAPWKAIDPAALTAPLNATGPVFVALLSNPLLHEGVRGLEFDVTLGWVAPGTATESPAELQARLGAADELCKYRAIVLKTGLLDNR
ncbi:MAG: prepilin-type N-terminal cleavage/methylation domain-containing protein [Opitutales bacterium]|jgi:hypothetical protein